MADQERTPDDSQDAAHRAEEHSETAAQEHQDPSQTVAEPSKGKDLDDAAEQERKEMDEARAEIKALEEADEVPSDPKDWPSGKAKFLTFDNDSGDGYGDGATAKIGPASLEHHEDGSVTIAGEPVDNPDDYKGEPIPGGPTDPNSPAVAGEREDFKKGDKS